MNAAPAAPTLSAVALPALPLIAALFGRISLVAANVVAVPFFTPLLSLAAAMSQGLVEWIASWDAQEASA